MFTAILFTIFASFLWGVTNHIDKFMITGIEKNKNSIKVLLVFSTFIAGMVLVPIWLILSHFTISISLVSLISVLSASLIYIIATLFYFKAIEKNDASIVVVMFQIIPVFSYILALILFKENLTIQKIIGSIIIIFSAIIISFDFNEKNNRKKFKALLLMTLSSVCYSIYFILFDIGIRNSSYYSCVFWYQIGLFIIGMVLLLLKSFRTPFLDAIKKNGKMYLILNTTNEVINLIAKLCKFTNSNCACKCFKWFSRGICIHTWNNRNFIITKIHKRRFKSKRSNSKNSMYYFGNNWSYYFSL